MLIPIFSLVALLNCASVLTLPAVSSQESLSPRQVAMGSTKNSTVSRANTGGTVLTEAQKEAQEEAAEKLPGLNTIASAYKELYYHDKYGSKRSDTPALVRMAGIAVGTNAPSGNPEAVSRAILLIFEPYNAKVGPPSSAAKVNAASQNMASTEAPSLNTIAHSLHEIWEKMVESPGPQPETSMLVKSIGQAIATSSTSGDPATVAKAIESAASKFMSN